MCFQVSSYTSLGMKNVGREKVVIQDWDHLDIKTISDCPIGGLNCEVPLYDIFVETNIKIKSDLGTTWGDTL